MGNLTLLCYAVKKPVLCLRETLYDTSFAHCKFSPEEMAQALSSQGLPSSAYPERTCRDTQGLWQIVSPDTPQNVSVFGCSSVPAGSRSFIFSLEFIVVIAGGSF